MLQKNSIRQHMISSTSNIVHMLYKRFVFTGIRTMQYSMQQTEQLLITLPKRKLLLLAIIPVPRPVYK